MPASGQPRSGPPMPCWHGLAIALAVLAVFALHLVFELRTGSRPGYPLDDPWIHLTFARNLAQGHGFVLSPEAQPVAGSTAPLWTLILALFHLFLGSGAPMVLAAKSLAAVLLILSSALAWRITGRLTGSRYASLAAGLGIATLSPLAWAMMSGMEVNLALLLGLLGLYCYLRWQTGWQAAIAWLVFGLAVYARPEGLAFLPLLVLDAALRRVAFKQHPVFWRGLAVFLLVLIPFFGFNLGLSGSLFPQTYLAKAGRTSLFAAISSANTRVLVALLFKAPFMYLWDFAVHLWRANPLLAFLAPVGIFGLVFRAIRAGRQASLLLPLICLGYVFIMGMTVPLAGPGYQHGRYISIPTGMAAIAAGFGAWFLILQVRRKQPALLLGTLLVLIAGFNAANASLASARNTAIQTRSTQRVQVAIADWLSKNTQPQATVACADIGAVSYLSNRTIIDLLGLANKEVLPYLGFQPGKPPDQGLLTYVRIRQPDFLVVFPSGFPSLANADFARPLAYARDDDNTAAQFTFVPSPRTLLGIVLTDVRIEPRPCLMAVLACDWSE